MYFVSTRRVSDPNSTVVITRVESNKSRPKFLPQENTVRYEMLRSGVHTYRHD
jgi:hypothetical protein